MVNDLEGIAAAITGGADGIGFSLAKAIAARGGRVALLDVRKDAVHDAAEALRSSGFEAVGVICDVSDHASVAAAADEVASHFGTVNLAWMNAGVGAAGHLNTAPANDIDWVHAVNVAGTINTVRTFWPLVADAKGLRHFGYTGSSIIFGHGEEYPHGIYAASKWASVGVAESLVGQAARAGIGTTIFCAGLLNTRIWDGARARPDRFGGAFHQPEHAGEFWRTHGMPVDWACEQAIQAVERNQNYCSPVFQRVVDDFDARTKAVRDSFIIYPNDAGSKP